VLFGQASCVDDRLNVVERLRHLLSYRVRETSIRLGGPLTGDIEIIASEDAWAVGTHRGPATDGTDHLLLSCEQEQAKSGRKR
jgi:hypothetical protein